jgi:ferrous iron transport protein B
MLFVLLYFPCIATIAAIRKELGIKWAIFVAIYNTIVAWLVAFAMYQVGSLF